MRAVGWVRIRLRGAVSGRRLNEMAMRMPVRRVMPVSGGMEMDVQAWRLNEIRHIFRGAGVRMHIVKRYGIVHLRRKAKRRGVLICACAAVLLGMLYLSQTALLVRVEGEKDARQEEKMLAVLEACGVKAGVYFGDVDKAAAAEEILRKIEGLTYASLKRKGMALELYVVQATKAPEIYDAGLRADVVAQTGGLVTRVVVLSGEAMVQPGDTVVRGQVLIRGTERMPHARGAVTARIWAVGTGEAELVGVETERTGRTQVQTYIRSGAWRYPQEVQSGFAQEETEEQVMPVLDGLFYPVEMVRCVKYETKDAVYRRTISQAKDESGARAMTNALLELENGACVVDKRVEYSMIEDGKLCAVATLEGVMQIGCEKAAAAPE